MLNSCNFHGRFAADPEMRTTQSGLAVVTFRMAVDRNTVDSNGQRSTDWLTFVAWRKTAEFICKYFHKGSEAVVESRCQTRQYQDKNGNNRTAVEFIVNNIDFCGSKQSDYVDDGGEAPPMGYQQLIRQNQQPQQMGFNTQSQRQQWQNVNAAPETVPPGYSQGNPDDFTVIDDSDDLPF